MRADTLQDHRERLLRVLVFIQRHLDEDLSLEQLAGVAHYSPYHFHRIFRGMVGESLQAHIRRIKLERAASQLQFTRRRIIEIAFDTGYETHEAFTRAFKDMAGLKTMATETKVDLYKLHKAEYRAPGKPTFVQTSKARYLAVSGRGAPGGEAFQAKIGALYAMAYTIKMTRKFEGKGDYVISKLEGQYWPDEGALDESTRPDELNWRLLIRTPDFVGKKDLKTAETKLTEKAKGKGEGVQDVEIFSLSEGKCVQMLHVGPYDKESETLEQMRTFADSEGFAVDGHHHEIYLSDPRRVAPEKLRTILRLPVTRKSRRF